MTPGRRCCPAPALVVLLTIGCARGPVAYAPLEEPGLGMPALDVDAGLEHACALLADGSIHCWGDNNYGQLGDGTFERHQTPEAVVAGGNDNVSVSAGRRFTCKLSQAGEVSCWGRNGEGQLGDGTTRGRAAPTPVVGLGAGVIDISGGGESACAVTAAGAARCWGYNRDGLLGNGTTVDSEVPVDVDGLQSGVASVSCSTTHCCAVLTAGGARCWGMGSNGELGQGAWSSSATPVDVVSLTERITDVSTGYYYTCAVTESGTVACWGANDYGQLGNGTTDDVNTPTPVPGLSGIKRVTTGIYHTCALSSAGTATCWGNNWGGQLGDETTEDRHSPTPIAEYSDLVALSAGGNNTCAVRADGRVICWGHNNYGQLGAGLPHTQNVPVEVPMLGGDLVQIAAGAHHTCALSGAGTVRCMGASAAGQSGTSEEREAVAVTDVVSLDPPLQMISAGSYHNCAVGAAGGIECWGTNNEGRLGNGSTNYPFAVVRVTGLTSGHVLTAAGGHHACAVTTTGTIQCWGGNNDGQLGTGDLLRSTVPIDPLGPPTGITALAAGGCGAHTCVSNANEVWCWGDNSDGQLGDGLRVDSNVPVQVPGLAGAAQLEAGEDHTCALSSAGGVTCWGGNGRAQLGDGSSYDSGAPVPVLGLSAGVRQIAVGDWHSCAITAAGGVMCWGGNEWGQLGDGTFENRAAPVDVEGLSAGVAHISAGGFHTCAVTHAGTAWCWGRSGSGQLGAVAAWSTVPVEVVDIGP